MEGCSTSLQSTFANERRCQSFFFFSNFEFMCTSVPPMRLPIPETALCRPLGCLGPLPIYSQSTAAASDVSYMPSSFQVEVDPVKQTIQNLEGGTFSRLRGFWRASSSRRLAIPSISILFRVCVERPRADQPSHVVLCILFAPGTPCGPHAQLKMRM